MDGSACFSSKGCQSTYTFMLITSRVPIHKSIRPRDEVIMMKINDNESNDEIGEGYLGLPTTVLGRPQTPIPNPNPNPTPIPYPNTNLGHPRTPDGNPGYV